MSFKDLDQLLSDTLELPIGGKKYSIPGCDAEFGLYCQRLLSAGVTFANGEEPPADAPSLRMDDEGEDAFYRRALGEAVWADLHADGVSWEKIKFVAQTAFFWHASGREMAEAFWNAGGDPKASASAMAPNRTARRSTATAAAKKTPAPASGSGTKSRPTRSSASARRP